MALNRSNLLYKHRPNWALGPVFASGSFGSVHIGHLYIDGIITTVAIKTAPVSHASSLRKEKAILRSLRGSPEIVRCLYSDVSYDKSTGKQLYHLFLELAPHRSLLDCIKANGRLQEPYIQAYTRSMLLGLYHIHGNGYVHCDIKPANILVWSDKNVKIADFGLTKRTGFKKGFRGTVPYMAPESLVRGEYEAKADVWALGCVVIEMATGKLAWKLSGGTKEEVKKEAVRVIGESDELPEFPQGMSKMGWDFLSKCLLKDPRERWTAEMLLKHPFVALHDDIDDGYVSEGDETERMRGG